MYYERISDKETGGTICEKAHRGQETIGFRRRENCIDIILNDYWVSIVIVKKQ